MRNMAATAVRAVRAVRASKGTRGIPGVPGFVMLVAPFAIAALIAFVAYYMLGAVPFLSRSDREQFAQDDDDGGDGGDEGGDGDRGYASHEASEARDRRWEAFQLGGDSNTNQYYLTDRARLEPDRNAGMKQYYTAWFLGGSNDGGGSNGGWHGGSNGGSNGGWHGGSNGGTSVARDGYLYDCACPSVSAWGASNGRVDREFSLHLIKSGFYRKTARAFMEAGAPEPERYMTASVARYRCGCFRLDDVARYASDTLEAERLGLVTASDMPSEHARGGNAPAMQAGSSNCGAAGSPAASGGDIIRRSVEAVYTLVAQGYNALAGGSNALGGGSNAPATAGALAAAEAAVRSGQVSLRQLWGRLQAAAPVREGFADEGVPSAGVPSASVPSADGGRPAADAPAPGDGLVETGFAAGSYRVTQRQGLVDTSPVEGGGAPADRRGNQEIGLLVGDMAEARWAAARADGAYVGPLAGGWAEASKDMNKLAMVGRPLTFPFPHVNDPLQSPQYSAAVAEGGGAKARTDAVYRSVFGEPPSATTSRMLVERYSEWGGDMRRMTNLVSTLFAVSSAESMRDGERDEAAVREALRETGVAAAAAALRSAGEGGDTGAAAERSGVRALDDVERFAVDRVFRRPELPPRGDSQALQDLVEERSWGAQAAQADQADQAAEAAQAAQAAQAAAAPPDT